VVLSRGRLALGCGAALGTAPTLVAGVARASKMVEVGLPFLRNRDRVVGVVLLPAQLGNLQWQVGSRSIASLRLRLYSELAREPAPHGEPTIKFEFSVSRVAAHGA
jgi:hypothetical protein